MLKIMADTNTLDGKVCAKEKRIQRMLPAKVKLTFGKACILCRKRPRVQGKGRQVEQCFHVSDGVFIPQSWCTYLGREIEGSYKLVNRWIFGRRIEVWPQKARGSRNHHKFLVTITNGSVS